MSKVLSDAAILSKDVQNVLRATSAESEFYITEQIVRESFPELMALNVYLQEDPDEEGITRVILEAVLPESMTFDLLHERKMAYYDAIATRLVDVEWPVCGLSIDLA